MKSLSNFGADGTITHNFFFFFFPPCNFVVHRELHKTLKIAACDGNAWCKREVWLPSLLRAHTRCCCGLQNISFYCWIKEWSRISLPDLGNTGSKSVIKCGNIYIFGFTKVVSSCDSNLHESACCPKNTQWFIFFPCHLFKVELYKTLNSQVAWFMAKPI